MAWIYSLYTYHITYRRYIHMGYAISTDFFYFSRFSSINDLLFRHHIVRLWKYCNGRPLSKLSSACEPDTRVCIIYIHIYYIGLVFIMPIRAIDRSRVSTYYYNIGKNNTHCRYLYIYICWYLLVVCDLKITIPWIGNVILKIEYYIVLESNIILLLLLLLL